MEWRRKTTAWPTGWTTQQHTSIYWVCCPKLSRFSSAVSGRTSLGQLFVSLLTVGIPGKTYSPSVLLKLGKQGSSEDPSRQRIAAFSPAEKLNAGGTQFPQFLWVYKEMRQKALRRKSERTSHKGVSQRHDILPSHLTLVMCWRNTPSIVATLCYKTALSSSFQHNYRSAPDQQEINTESWKGAVNINIIQLLGTNIAQ